MREFISIQPSLDKNSDWGIPEESPFTRPPCKQARLQKSSQVDDRGSGRAEALDEAVS